MAGMKSFVALLAAATAVVNAVAILSYYKVYKKR
jgi:hypothetical protein